ncbi:MAG: tRNA guanosine(15) transglycosylase TgtA [Desulfurococcales archaeon]|nr:tRNA guanosine(15) transglycosylase TgtA [Desulfurococcales archaeon]
MFEVREVDLAGRIGRLYTKSGTIETPAFFPVIDVARQEVNLEEVRDVGFNQIITNAYLLLKRYGEKVAEEGIHRFLGWDGVVMTDSGAYQILQYGEVAATQEEIIDYQVRIGSDISVILDIPTGDVDRASAERSVRITLERARRAVEHIRDTPNLWVLPVQGGRFLDLVEMSAREASRLEGYSVYAVGSPTVFLERYKYRTVLKIASVARRNLPLGKPVHLFGAGHPLIIPYAVALGMDLFDSASYILYARDGRVFTDYGVERLERLHYLPCTCPHCAKRSPQELLEMPSRERTRILALHNLCMIKKYLDETKQAIKEGRLWELLEAVSRHHPSAYESFHTVAENLDLILKVSPRLRGVIRGVRGYSVESLSNPKLYYYRSKILEMRYKPKVSPHSRVILAPYPSSIEECSPPRLSRDPYVIYYHPLLGVVPMELCGVFPTIHVHWPSETPGGSMLSRMVEDVVSYTRRLIEDLKVEILVDARDPWGVRDRIRKGIVAGSGGS